MEHPHVRARTWARIDLDRLRANARAVGAQVGGVERILATVKADAYGHGAVEVARALVDEGVEWFGVATVAEGAELRDAGVVSRILVLSPTLSQQADAAVDAGLTLTVGSVECLEALDACAIRRGTKVWVHLPVDTGMGRDGVLPDDVSGIVERARKMEGIALEGISTHFPAADDLRRAFTLRQIRRMDHVLESVDPNRDLIRHMANSAGLLHFPDSVGDLVRPGLLLYGLFPAERNEGALSVSPVLNFYSRVVHVKTLPEKHPVSYGRTWYTSRPTRIATVAVGYADGFYRSLSGGRGCVLVGGARCPVRGAVTMDMTMVEVPADVDVTVGDEVVLVGTQGAERITAWEMAARRGTIPWEVLTDIGPRVPRVYREGGKSRRARALLGTDRVRDPIVGGHGAED